MKKTTRPTIVGFSGVDLFGSRQITIEQVVDLHRHKLEALARAHGDGGLYSTRKSAVVKAVNAMGEFAFVDVAVVDYLDGDRPYLTIDLVDVDDSAIRMTFDTWPAGDFDDPGGVLAVWEDYTQVAGMLAKSAEGVRRSASCPVFHCMHGFEHSELAPFLPVLRHKAREHKNLLLRILREDGDSGKRAAAAFVLAHLNDGAAVLAAMLTAFRDMSPLVRNNAMRVVAMIAKNHQEITVPIAPVLAALLFPATSDRNKALAILAQLSKRAEHRETILDEVGLTLLEILRLRQPNNHDYAYVILKNISGENFGERAYDRWTKWMRSQGTAKHSEPADLTSMPPLPPPCRWASK
tara:strand:+ start:26032 stop:27084 length:1053 start_codon:yes stop_codon:yes gene_type:complete